MDKTKRFEGEQYRSFEGGLRVIDEEKRTAELSFSSETPVTRWGEDEILSHSDGAVMLERIKTTGCLLFNHNRDYVIGRILDVKIEDGKGRAIVCFDEDEQSDIIFQKVRTGTLKGVSVGYRILEYEVIQANKTETGRQTYIATLWEPLEISIVSVPADISVGVGRAVNETAGINSGYKNYVDYQVKINQNLIKIKGGAK